MRELSEIYTDWQDKLDQDEWYFSPSFEKIIERLTPIEAFDSIPSVINELIKLREPYLIGETLDFLQSIYHKADTTEVHPVVKRELKNIETVVQNVGDDYSKNALREWKTFLRIK